MFHPRQRATAANDPHPAIPLRLLGADRGAPRAIVVSSNAAVRRSAALYLRLAAGCEVETSSAHPNALARCAVQHPSLLLAHLLQREAPELPLLQQLRECTGAPLLLLASDPNIDVAWARRCIGAEEVFQVPVEPERLLASVQRLLARPSQPWA